MASSSVRTRTIALPLESTVTTRVPVSPATAKSPVCPTPTRTSTLAAGGGFNSRLKSAVPPSVTSSPLDGETLATGVFAGGSSLSMMVRVWTRRAPTV